MKRLFCPLVVLSLLAAFSTPRLLHAQPYSMRAELKGGDVVEASVEQVTAWGFWLEGGQGLLYRQLVQLQTESEALRDSVLAFVPKAQVERSGTVYTVRLGHLEVVPRVPRSRTALRAFKVWAGPSFGSRVGFETAFDVSTHFSGPLVFQFGHNIGWKVSGGGYLGGYTFGTGVQVPVGGLRVLLMANAWKQYLHDENERAEDEGLGVTLPAPVSFSVSLFGESAFGASPYSMQVGVRYFLRQIELPDPEPRGGIVLGLCRKL